MKATRFFAVCLLSLLIAGCKQSPSLDQYVDTRIGNTNGGRTYRGAVMPWGMASVAPYYLNPEEGFDKSLVGFGMVNLSGVGCSDVSGAVILMPYNGSVETSVSDIVSTFSNEVTTAGVYDCTLDAYDIGVQTTATVRSNISRYTFNDTNREAVVKVDLTKHLNHKFNESSIKQLSDTEVVCVKSQGSFCSASNDIGNIYFYMKFSKPIVASHFWSLDGDTAEEAISGMNVGGSFSFGNISGLEVRVGVSYVSEANARLNLEAEQTGKSFEQLAKASVEAWNNVLSKIEVDAVSEDEKTMFYTALYHCLQHPNVFSDVNGEYRTMRKHEVKKAVGYTRYTLYSLWDSYRNVHTLLGTLFPDVQRDMVVTMLEMYRESGFLPKWEHMGFETFNMNGAPATSVVVDGYMKGLDFDYELAYEAVTKDALYDDRASEERVRPGLEVYNSYQGMIPHNLTGEREFIEWRKDTSKPRPQPPVWGPVSTTIEYNYADWCISQLAKGLGKDDDANRFYYRSLGYRYYYNPAVGFLAPRNSDGSWYEPIDLMVDIPFGNAPAYVEGNAWHYLFAASHDIEGTKELLGGEAAYTKRLNECFELDEYILWNEPDMFYPYLYTHIAGEEFKTQQLVPRYIREQYNTGMGGIPGNDDVGTLSAFLVYGMLGFYPVNPVSNNYEMSVPMVKSAKVHLPNGNVLNIKQAPEGSVEPVLNGEPMGRFILTHDELMKGGTLTFRAAK